MQGYEQVLAAQGPDSEASQRARQRLHDFYLAMGRTEAAAQQVNKLSAKSG